MSCFNVIFTFLPPLVIGIFDQFVSARLLDKYPQMYMLGQSNEFFNQRRFWGWFANAVYHSLVSFYFYFIFLVYFIIIHLYEVLNTYTYTLSLSIIFF